MRPEFVCVIDGKPQWNVSKCELGSSGRYQVVFSKDGQPSKSFSYGRERVKKYYFKRTESGEVFFRTNDGRYFKESCLHVYGDEFGERYYVKEKDNGFLEFYPAEERSLHHSVKESESSLFHYLQAIAKLNQIPTEEGEGNISLSQKYKNIENVFDDSVMAMYLAPKKHPPVLGGTVPFLIFPFGCNSGQWEAVSNAAAGDVSVIQGPPGTGKTQTILNIVANQILQRKTTQIVSNNNSAVANVKEKLDAGGYGFLAVTLGRREFKEAFFASQSGEYPDMSAWKRSQEEISSMRMTISELTSGLPKYFSGLERLSSLREELEELKEQERTFEESVMDPDVRKKSMKDRLYASLLNPLRLPSGKLYRFLFRVEEQMQRQEKLSFSLRCTSFYYGFGYHFPGREIVERTARKKKVLELEKEKSDIEGYCRDFKPRYERYVALSKEYFNAFLYTIYQSDNPDRSRKIYSPDDLWKNPAPFLKDYPVVLSSAYSATTNISKNYTFDMLIMDEASQCDVAVGALALNSARRAVIVGDEKQLPNVIPDALKEKAVIIGRTFLAPSEYAFEGRSFLSSFRAVFPEAPIAFLKEHYRCEPRIIGYCNQQFYDGRLVAMTARSEENPLSVIVAAKDTHPRPQQNEPQAQECVKRVLELRQQFPDIGVIVPYNAQAKLISELLSADGISEDDIPVSTVHKFQGREKDAILLCTVDNTVKEFVDDPHLLNVAVSRARKNFTLVVSDGEIPEGNIKALRDYVEYCSGQIVIGSIRSVFDILYKPYKEEREAYIKEHQSVSEYITENIVSELLDSITSEQRWAHLGTSFQYPLKAVVANWKILSDDEKRYTANDMTLIDFVLYEKTTKRPVLAIEVDGMSYHKEGTRQWERDRMKDSVLEKMGLPLLRLPTNGKREKERIESALLSIFSDVQETKNRLQK